ncbi:MAG: alanine--tRNA ligase [Holosporales bacterium]|jgi:alanyl-tRNA synthetase|nr:alanine--tRNA ligase [Holosporales bacterium]
MQGKMASLNNIRTTFLSYFEKCGHKVVPSSKLVPENDPTLLFTNAGMNQFKDYFTGKKVPPFTTATTAQKCVRAGGKHNDLDNVGYTARHHTFFEMLGNFSFGDYFKEQAIFHAWQVVTREFGLPPERLCVTIFSEDDEAYSIWKKLTGFPDSKIIRIATSDNFWSMGNTGPCGPCTEIFYDHGDSIFGGPPGSADADGDRFTEIWNLVFMQYEQLADGTRVELPRPCIDTGMGLERIAAILQGKHNNFDVDIFADLIQEIREITGKKEGEAQSCNVIADHIRSISFLIADGVTPLNDGRGYVLRRIIRRAFRHARMLGATEPMLYKLVDKLSQLMGSQYPELNTAKALVTSTIKEEEMRFDKTLDKGLHILGEALEQLKGNVLPGGVAFKLYDTYGFPLDLTSDILKSKEISVDLEGFDAAMEEQRQNSRQAGTLGIKVSGQKFDFSGIPPTIPEWYHSAKDYGHFDPISTCNSSLSSLERASVYDEYSGQDATVLAVIELSSNESKRHGIVLDRSPFFPEGCGQAGDTGILVGVHGSFIVERTYKVTGDDKTNTWIVHEGQMQDGELNVGENIAAHLYNDKRSRIRAHHSATHLLQAELRRLLAPLEVRQHGSDVDVNRLRFDFNLDRPLSTDEIHKIESQVNAVILKALPCQIDECSKDDPLAQKALAYFDEKYDDVVRVVQLGKLPDGSFVSTELCGGLHVANTGQIGLFKVISEASISSGIRRIEAVCGEALLGWFEGSLKGAVDEATQLREEHKRLSKQLRRALSANQKLDVSKEVVGKTELAVYRTDAEDASQVREVAENVQKNLETGIAVVIGVCEGKGVVVVCVANSEQSRGIKANNLVKQVCDAFDVRGGGKATIAQAGGLKDVEAALRLIKDELNRI